MCDRDENGGFVRTPSTSGLAGAPGDKAAPGGDGFVRTPTTNGVVAAPGGKTAAIPERDGFVRTPITSGLAGRQPGKLGPGAGGDGFVRTPVTTGLVGAPGSKLSAPQMPRPQGCMRHQADAPAQQAPQPAPVMQAAPPQLPPMTRQEMLRSYMNARAAPRQARVGFAQRLAEARAAAASRPSQMQLLQERRAMEAAARDAAAADAARLAADRQKAWTHTVQADPNGGA